MATAELTEAARRKVFRSGSPIYMDYNATTPVAPEVLAAMTPYLSFDFGNPSSAHPFSARPKAAIAKAREQIASFLGRSDPSEVVFTSGGTECINWVLRSVCRQAFLDASRDSHHLVVSSVEHPAVLGCAEWCKSTFGTRVTQLPVDDCGRVLPAALKKAICEDTVCVCVMHSNNEIGTVNDIGTLVQITKQASADIWFLSDTTQSMGKCSLSQLRQLTHGSDDDDSGDRKPAVDFLCFGAHKIYGPKGIGALWINPCVRSRVGPLIVGAGQEMGLRAGTENVAYSVALGKACQLLHQELKDSKYLAHYKTFCDLFVKQLMQSLPRKHHKRVRLNGDAAKRLFNTLSISFALLKGDELVRRLAPRIALSAGAACHSDTVDMSHVLVAMRADPKFAMGTIRVSIGRYTTKSDVLIAANLIAKEVSSMYDALARKPQSKL